VCGACRRSQRRVGEPASLKVGGSFVTTERRLFGRSVQPSASSTVLCWHVACTYPGSDERRASPAVASGSVRAGSLPPSSKPVPFWSSGLPVPPRAGRCSLYLFSSRVRGTPRASVDRVRRALHHVARWARAAARAAPCKRLTPIASIVDGRAVDSGLNCDLFTIARRSAAQHPVTGRYLRRGRLAHRVHVGASAVGTPAHSASPVNRVNVAYVLLPPPQKSVLASGGRNRPPLVPFCSRDCATGWPGEAQPRARAAASAERTAPSMPEP
jgi:hypothetical protein